MEKKKTRYWFGYLQVSILKYRLGGIFTSKYGRILFPYVFFLSKSRESKIFNDEEKMMMVRRKRQNSNITDMIYSRGFFYP